MANKEGGTRATSKCQQVLHKAWPEDQVDAVSDQHSVLLANQKVKTTHCQLNGGSQCLPATAVDMGTT
jgi:hypothetical protein